LQQTTKNSSGSQDSALQTVVQLHKPERVSQKEFHKPERSYTFQMEGKADGS